MAPRTVTTLHGRQDLPDLQELYAAFPDVQLISISDAQRSPVPNANFVGTVHHGLPSNFCNRPSPPPEDTLRFSVRISPEKRVDRAIAVARAAGLLSPLIKTDPAVLKIMDPASAQGGVRRGISWVSDASFDTRAKRAG